MFEQLGNKILSTNEMINFTDTLPCTRRIVFRCMSREFKFLRSMHGTADMARWPRSISLFSGKSFMSPNIFLLYFSFACALVHRSAFSTTWRMMSDVMKNEWNSRLNVDGRHSAVRGYKFVCSHVHIVLGPLSLQICKTMRCLPNFSIGEAIASLIRSTAQRFGGCNSELGQEIVTYPPYIPNAQSPQFIVGLQSIPQSNIQNEILWDAVIGPLGDIGHTLYGRWKDEFIRHDWPLENESRFLKFLTDVRKVAFPEYLQYLEHHEASFKVFLTGLNEWETVRWQACLLDFDTFQTSMVKLCPFHSCLFELMLIGTIHLDLARTRKEFVRICFFQARPACLRYQ
jgi:hypothetical protein